MNRSRPATIHPIACRCKHCSPPWLRCRRSSRAALGIAIGATGAAIGALPLLYHLGAAMVAALFH